MKRRILNTMLIALIGLTFVSCNKEKVIFEKQVTFTDNTWLRQEAKSFDINIDNTDDCYNIYFSMAIDTTRIRGNNFPLVVNLFGENGERRMFYSYLFLKNNEGTWLVPIENGKAIVNQMIKEYFFFNHEGTYRLEVGQGTDRYEIKGVDYFGVKIQEAELIYPE